MQKLRLELDDLTVTSFDTAEETEEQRGTIEAQELAPTRRTRCPTCETLCLPFC